MCIPIVYQLPAPFFSLQYISFSSKGIPAGSLSTKVNQNSSVHHRCSILQQNLEIIKRKKTSIHESTTFLLYTVDLSIEQWQEESWGGVITSTYTNLPFPKIQPFSPLPEIWIERVLHRNVFMLPPPILEQGNYRKTYAGLATCSVDEEEQEIPFPRNKLFPRLIDPSSFFNQQLILQASRSTTGT